MSRVSRFSQAAQDRMVSGAIADQQDAADFQALANGSAGWDPTVDPLGVGLQASARARRDQFQRRTQSALEGLRDNGTIDTGTYIQANMNNQFNDSRASTMADPNWDAWFEALRQAGGGKMPKLRGGASPRGSSQLHGTRSPQTQLSIDAITQSPLDAPKNPWSLG